MPSVERAPQEKATLFYETSAEAERFRQEVAEKIEGDQVNNTERPRELIAEAVASEISSHGEGVSLLSRPWEHTQAEHVEAQALVDLAFSKDLGAALKTARQSEHYPRNLDLFHDVLTSEMYEQVVQHKLNRQRLSVWVVLALTLFLAAVLGIMLLVAQL